MKRSGWKTWALFGLVVLGAAAGLAWISAVLLRFEGESLEAEERERLHADLRLAVWRIDSLMAPVLTEEAARPPDQYRSFFPLSKSYDAVGGANKGRDVFVPSPILKPPSDWAILNFQVESSGAFHSPQVPPDHLVSQAVANGVSQEDISLQRRRLASLSASVEGRELERRIDAVLSERSEKGSEPRWFVFNTPSAGEQSVQTLASPRGQKEQSYEDFNARQRAVNRMAGQQRAAQENWYAPPVVRLETSEVSHLVPLWLPGGAASGPLLVLVRRVRSEGRTVVQGVLVDWPRLKAMAEEEVRDLFPSAGLRPAREGFAPEPDRALAVLPAELDPGPRPETPGGDLFTPVRVGLAALWTAFLAGAAVVAAGLRGLLALNRRRLDFVSAVTHELRTPLTTFRMYTEMLKEGMVPEERRSQYFETLFEESGRLSHLVQNVLDYSRLESNRSVSRIETAPLEEHLSKALPPLGERCERKGVPFHLDLHYPGDAPVALDASALAQILFNLVDNACKYGEGEVRLDVSLEGRRVRFAVSDEGKALEGEDRERLFEPFVRGESSRDRGAGVGLGLALCRRWARALGGDLELEVRDGARFVLVL